MLSGDDLRKDLQVGDSGLFSVVPGWTFVGKVQELREHSLVLSPAAWVETLTEQNTVSHLQHSKSPKKVADRAWPMTAATIPYQAVCWYAKMLGDATAFDLSVDAIKKAR